MVDSRRCKSLRGSPHRKTLFDMDRATVQFTPAHQAFLVREKRFALQYAQIYARRLDQLRPVVRESASKAWFSGPGVCSSRLIFTAVVFVGRCVECVRIYWHCLVVVCLYNIVLCCGDDCRQIW